jgi:hypothetical protein
MTQWCHVNASQCFQPSLASAFTDGRAFLALLALWWLATLSKLTWPQLQYNSTRMLQESHKQVGAPSQPLTAPHSPSLSLTAPPCFLKRLTPTHCS